MKTFITQHTKTFAAIALMAASSTGMAAGLMTPANTNLSNLEIEEHHVNVIIEDGYAITTIEQTFHNPHNNDMEAIYSFPIPEKAAVGEFTYWIDGKPVTGEVLEKQKARTIYEEEKNAGRETAITEQDSYKTFDMSVHPVRAQQDVKVRLSYIQPAHVDTSIGRYVYPLEDGGVDEQKLAFWSYEDAVQEKFSFNMLFRSSYPIDALRLPEHPQAQVKQLSEKEWSISMENGQTAIEEEGTAPALNNGPVYNLDKDIVVYWRHAQDKPASVDMVAYKGPQQDMGTFMLTVTPGDDLEKITEGRDWVFVLDFSGSMQGKYNSLIEGVSKGLAKLNPNDRFRLILFNNNAQEITRGYANATPENVRHYIQEMESRRPNGSTNLYAGLKDGIQSLDADRSSAIILVTDGVANVGTTQKKEFLSLIENKDTRLFTFVMGNSANRPLLESMTEVSNGFAISVSNSDDIAGKLMEATSKMTHKAFHDVDITFDGIKVRDLTPERIGSLYRGEQLVVFGHYWGDGQADVTINAKVSGEKKTYKTSFEFPKQSELYPELERLWSFAKIEDLQNKMDYFGADKDTEQAITDLAVDAGLVTNYTSMLVVREEEFVNRSIDRKNAKRVQQEHQAQQQRKAQPVRDHRVDRQQPISTRPAASHSGSGGGSFGYIPLIFIPLILGLRRRFKL